MLLDVVLAASVTPAPAPDTTTAGGTPWVVVAAAITGLIAIVVALISGWVQARIARNTAAAQAALASKERRDAREREERTRKDQRERDDRARADQEERDRRARNDQQQRDERARKEERAREDRLERANMHEAIALELTSLTEQYREIVLEIERTGNESRVGYQRPDSGPLLRTLNRLVVRFGEDDLCNDVLGYYGAALEHTKFRDMDLVIGTIHERLAHWFLGRRSTLETRRMLQDGAELLAAGVLPSAAAPAPLPPKEPLEI